MTPDDVRLTAQLVVAKRVHCVSDEAVMAMARRLLALEANHQKAAEDATLRARAEADLADMERKAAHWSEALRMAVAEEREACAKLVGDVCVLGSGNEVRTGYATAIRARGAK